MNDLSSGAFPFVPLIYTRNMPLKRLNTKTVPIIHLVVLYRILRLRGSAVVNFIDTCAGRMNSRALLTRLSRAVANQKGRDDLVLQLALECNLGA